MSRDLSENQLTGDIPPTIGNLRKLELLYVITKTGIWIKLLNLLKESF